MSRTPILSVIRRGTKQRFWKRVKARNKPGQCWEFPGHRNAQGRGVLQITYQNKAVRYSILAHRLAWVLANEQEIPEDKIICHRCDNGACCNPAHLYLGTPQTNASDMLRRGRNVETKPWLGVRGERHPRSGYSDAQRVAALELRKAGTSYADIERQVGCSRSAASYWFAQYTKSKRP